MYKNRLPTLMPSSWPIRTIAAAALLLLPACSDAIPSAVNPWAEEQAAESETPIDTDRIPGEDDPSPNLATVPDRPKPVLDPDQRAAVIEGLVADRENAVYTDGTGPGRAAQEGEAPVVTPATRQTVAAAEIEPAAGSAAGGADPRIGTIVFDTGAADLPGYAGGILQEIATTHQTRGGTLWVVGHAGTLQGQSRGARLRLAMARAQTVAAALSQQGVPVGQVQTTANADGVVADDTGGARVDVYLGR